MSIKTNILSRWQSLPAKLRYLGHVIAITALIVFVLYIVSILQVNVKSVNPLTRSLVDYEITDVVFAKFRDRSIINFEDDIVVVNTGKPNRSQITQAVEKINKFKPSAIGLDILFKDRMDPTIDQKLRKVFRESSNLVLATVLGSYNAEKNEFEYTKECNPYFCDSIPTGFINFVAKPETTIRLFSVSEQTDDVPEIAFAARVAQLANPEKASKLLKRKRESMRINYKGGLESFVHYDIDQLINSNQDLSAVFEDKIVLFGYMGSDEWSQSSRDKFYTPLNDKVAAKSLPDMFGVVIHANIISMILDESYIAEMPDWLNKFLSIFIIMLSVAVIRMDFISYKKVYWIVIKVLQVLVFIFLFFLVAGLFYFFNVRLNLTAGIFGVFIAYDIIDFYENILLPKLTSFWIKNTEQEAIGEPQISNL